MEPFWSFAIAGVHFLGIAMIGLFVALLLAAVAPPARFRRSMGPPHEPVATEAAGWGLFFWTLLVLLPIAAVIAHVDWG